LSETDTFPPHCKTRAAHLNYRQRSTQYRLRRHVALHLGHMRCCRARQRSRRAPMPRWSEPAGWHTPWATSPLI